MSGFVNTLDGYGKPAWIAAMVTGFVLFWPIGLLILFYLWRSGRMGCGTNRNWGEHARERMERKVAHLQEKLSRWGERGSDAAGFTPSGNRAFDEYRAETLKRLEDEAKQFRDFLDQLRHARDKAECDQFIASRRASGAGEAPNAG